MTRTPKNPRPVAYKDASKALEAVEKIYKTNIEFLQKKFQDFVENEGFNERVRACYPYAKISTTAATRTDNRLSYGFLPKPGTYVTTLTRPDIFDHYFEQQFVQLLKNHDVPIEIGVSEEPIPIHFALGEDFHLEGDLDEARLERLSDHFDVPDLDVMDDEIANSTYIPGADQGLPLALFGGARVDVSLQRLKHYTGTNAKHFQNYVIFTNYQFYIDEFIKLSKEMMVGAENYDLRTKRSQYTAFVEPGNFVTVNKNLDEWDGDEETIGQPGRRMPQMPAYHLKSPNGCGITMVNIGVGPSNAKTITDHIAVLRPHAWLMLGHCAGLRNSQALGDYVLAHGYLRDDKILDRDLPVDVPIPALAEMQQCLEQAVEQVTGFKGYDLKKIMRTGTVATTDNRNWEFRSALDQNKRLSQSRAIAMDMESGTIAANGFRFRVPYGTLLCVSDKPLHGQLKLPGMANSFYRERVDQHLQIGILTMELLKKYGTERLHSRKLRSFNEVAFQ